MANDILNLNVFEKRFRNLFKEAPFSAALLVGSEFIVEMANEATLQLWGKDSSIIGKPLLEAMPEIKDQHVFKLLQQIYQSGEPFEGQEQAAYLHVDGALKKVYVNFSYKPIRDDDGIITGVLAVGYDVTDQVVARQKLEESEARTKLIIDAVGFGTFERDFITNKINTSPRFDALFGFDEPHEHEDYINRIHPDDITIRNAAQEKALTTGKLFYEARVVWPDKSIHWIRIDGIILFDAQGNPTRMLGIGLDITEEKKALMKIQESELRFRTLITETPEVGAAIFIGRDLRIQYVNDVMLRFWGKDNRVISKTLREAMPILEGQPFFDQLRQVYTTGVAFSGKEVKAYLEVNGKVQPRYFNYTYKALKNHDDEIYAIHHMAVDVTEQVESKIALIESEEAVRQLFAQTPVGIAVFKGKDLVIEMANTTILSYWGRTSEEALNKPLWQVLPEVAAQGIAEITDQVFRTGVPYKSPETPVEVFRHGKTETLIVHFAFLPQRNKSGDIIGLMGIAHDVSDLVNARKKAEKNELRLHDLANSMPQVVWIAEAGGAVTYYNDRVELFSGVKKEGPIWKWEGIVHPDDVARTHEIWRSAVTNLVPYEIEHRIKMKDGSYRWHLSRAFPYVREEGIRWYGTATDVHDRKLLEMNLENIVKERTLQLQRSNEDLQQFAHVASHDLKEPVRKIKTFSFKLQEDFTNLLGDRGNTYLNKIIHACDRIYSMIDGVLKYASLPSTSVVSERVDLNTVIKSIESDLEVMIAEKKATITYSGLPTIHGILPLLYQLFYNLINNSLKFSKVDTPPRITITCSETLHDNTTYYKITLADNGIGFDPMYGEKIFHTFFRLNSKDKYEGTGLGLALSKKIVERHNGLINATSEKDNGAQFIILLPK